MTFPVIPVNNRSLKNRKLVEGVGVNDADYQTQPTVNGKRIICPFYRKWHAMLIRCYSKKHLKSQPSYVGCSVCKEWLTFSTFKKWMVDQEWEGKHLDKDILNKGNKIYSPNGCIFVSNDINSLIVDSGKRRGKHPKGVHYQKAIGKFQVCCKIRGKSTHVGYYSNAIDASEAYIEFKREHIAKIALTQKEPLKSALLTYDV